VSARRLLATVLVAGFAISVGGCAVFDRDLRDLRACEGLADVTSAGGSNLAEGIRAEALPYASARLGRDLHTLATLTRDVENGSVVPSPGVLRQLDIASDKVLSRCAEVTSLGLPSSSDSGSQPEPAERVSEQHTDTEPVAAEPQDPATSNQDSALAGSLSALRIQAEERSGYDRDLFAHWIDADGNGCDTRREVLIRDSLTPVEVGPGCEIYGGTWLSHYDGFTSSNPGDFDIDHLVALAEAWDSGASSWSDQRRQEFANDLSFRGSLLVVSAQSNRSKSDKDPSDWLPPDEAFHCEYVTLWIEVKTRWDLSVDDGEVSALDAIQARC